MKKSQKAAFYLLSALYAFMPLLSAVLLIFGYTAYLFSYSFFSVFLALVSVAAVISIIRNKHGCANKNISIISAFLPILATVNWIIYLFKSQDIRNEAVVVAVCMPICLICAVIITSKLCKPSGLKIAGIILPLLAVIPLLFFSFLTLLPIGKNAVINTVSSPNGAFHAEIVDSDQGALGGNTLVYVQKNSGFDAFFFSIKKRRERVYLGDWGEYENMQIYWKDENTLIINSKEYIIA